MPAHQTWPASPIRRYLLDEDSPLGELLLAAIGRVALSMTSGERLMALAVAVMLVAMLAAAWMSLDTIDPAVPRLNVPIT